MNDVLNTSMPYKGKKLKVLSDSESEMAESLAESSFDYEDLRHSSRRFSKPGQNGMKLSLNLSKSKSKPVPPSQPSGRSTFLRSAHGGRAGAYTNRSSVDIDRDRERDRAEIGLTDRSNISELFNQIIDEEMAKNSALTERSGISLKKQKDGWASEFDSDIDTD